MEHHGHRSRYRVRSIPVAGWFLAAMLLLAGCGGGDRWPPAPRDKEEVLILEAAKRATRQLDGWSEVAYVIQKSGAVWEVQAWKIVHPKARGRKKCVPWAVRSITIDSAGMVTDYRNTL